MEIGKIYRDASKSTWLVLCEIPPWFNRGRGGYYFAVRKRYRGLGAKIEHLLIGPERVKDFKEGGTEVDVLGGKFQ